MVADANAALTTADQWWRQPGLSRSSVTQFGSPPPATLGGQTYNWADPWTGYQWYQSAAPDVQALVAPADEAVDQFVQPLTPMSTATRLPGEGDRAGIGAARPMKRTEEAPQQVQQQIPELPQYLIDMSDDLMRFYGERMSPDYTAMGPAQRAALDRQIGQFLSVAQRQSMEDLARTGLYSSGIESQMDMGSAMAAAQAMARAAAGVEAQDEATRQWAANQMAGLRSGDQARWLDQLRFAGMLPIDEAGALAPYVFAGPTTQWLDPTALFQAGWTMDRLEEEERKAREAGETDLADLFQMLLAGVGTL